MDKFKLYVTLVIIIKVCFIIASLAHVVLKAKGQENSALDVKLLYWKERFEFVFIFLMSMLLIYVFNPHYGSNIVHLTYETKLLLYLFGFILLLTADWNHFFKEAKWVKVIQEIIGTEGTK